VSFVVSKKQVEVEAQVEDRAKKFEDDVFLNLSTPVHKFGNKNPSRPPFGKGRRTPL
jgi:hypothetical protein